MDSGGFEIQSGTTASHTSDENDGHMVDGLLGAAHPCHHDKWNKIPQAVMVPLPPGVDSMPEISGVASRMPGKLQSECCFSSGWWQVPLCSFAGTLQACPANQICHWLLPRLGRFRENPLDVMHSIVKQQRHRQCQQWQDHPYLHFHQGPFQIAPQLHIGAPPWKVNLTGVCFSRHVEISIQRVWSLSCPSYLVLTGLCSMQNLFEPFGSTWQHSRPMRYQSFYWLQMTEHNCFACLTWLDLL